MSNKNLVSSPHVLLWLICDDNQPDLSVIEPKVQNIQKNTAFLLETNQTMVQFDGLRPPETPVGQIDIQENKSLDEFAPPGPNLCLFVSTRVFALSLFAEISSKMWHLT